MIIENQFNNMLVEIMEDKIVIKKGFGRKKLERRKINAVYLDEYYRLKVLYDNKPLIFNMANIKTSHEFRLNQLIDTLNRGSSIFINGNSYTLRYYSIFFTTITVVSIINSISMKQSIREILFFVVLMFIVLSITYISNPKFGSVVYDFKENFIEYYDWKCTKKRIKAIDKRFDFKDREIKNGELKYLNNKLNNTDKKSAVKEGYFEYYDSKNNKKKIEVYEKIYSFKKKGNKYKFKVKGARRSINTAIVYPNSYKRKLEELCDRE